MRMERTSERRRIEEGDEEEDVAVELLFLDDFSAFFETGGARTR